MVCLPQLAIHSISRDDSCIEAEAQLWQQTVRYNELVIHDVLLATEESFFCHASNSAEKLQLFSAG